MRPQIRPLLAVVAVVLLAAPGARALDLGDGLIRLRHETYSRAAGPAPAAERERPLAPGEMATWVLAVSGPAGAEVREAVAAVGARVVGYVPSNAYLVRGTAGAIEALRAEPFTARADRYRDAWKLSPDIGKRTFRDPARRALAPSRLLELIVFAGEDPAAVADGARAAGAQVVSVAGPEQGRRVVVVAAPEALPSLAALSGVEWIDDVAEPALRNDAVRWVIQSNVQDETPLHDHGLLGAGEIIGHIDGEILMTSCFFEDLADNTPGPSHRKVVGYRSSGNLYGNAHGTHTAGTAAGDREPTTGSLLERGMAPKARLSFGNVNDITGFNDVPSNLLTALDAAHADGARIHTNSWGEGSLGTYVTLSVDVDTFSRQNEEDLVCFAVVNGGTSVIAPENAKNCLAVAATQGAPNQDLHGSGAPGPTFDGRRKPEVMAPGVNTISAALAGCAVAAMTGTSMASPAVAGGAALAREYFRRGYYPGGRAFAADSLTPTGALLRAVVINSGRDISGVSGYPSNLEGWGRILLDDALYFAGDSRRLLVRDVRHAAGLSTGQTRSIPFQVRSSFEPLAVTMAFTDQPAAHAAALTPVNDLDLELESPGGTVYLGNVFDTVAGVSETGGSADPLNDVERVVVVAPAPGTWIVRVRATDVPMGPQGFAVAVNGALLPVLLGGAPAPPEHQVGKERVLAGELRLEPVRPSPFRGPATIRFAVPAPTTARVLVYDVRGRRVRTLRDAPVSAGWHDLTWDGRTDDGRTAAAGIYFVRLLVPGAERTVRGVLLR